MAGENSGSIQTSTLSNLEQLPNELILVIISYLDAESFSNLRSVNRSCKKLCDSASPQLCHYYWSKINANNKRTCMMAKEMYHHQLSDSSVEEHISLLLKTLAEVDSQVILRLSHPESTPSRDYIRLCKIFSRHIETARRVIHSILTHQTQITVNFGMLDLCIRRSFKELVSMFPVNEELANTFTFSSSSTKYEEWVDGYGNCLMTIEEKKPYHPHEYHSVSRGSVVAATHANHTKPSDCISDLGARKAWNQAFPDPKGALVDFAEFFDKVILHQWPDASEHPYFASFFCFFSDFPRDNYMSPFKWDTLVKQFGPFENFYENFLKYGCEYGFLGLVNSVDADRILHHKIGSYAFRFSRQEPEKLTLSFCVKSSRGSRVYHRRKPHDMSIPEFLETHLHSKSTSIKFKPVQQRLDPEATSLESIEEFLGRSEYFITDEL